MQSCASGPAVVQYEPDGRKPSVWQKTVLRRSIIEPRELADTLMELAAGKKASRIVLLDLRKISIIADYFLICSGESERQLQAIADEVWEKMEARGVPPRRMEGTADSGWILMDFGAVVLHVFDPPRRDFYRLEEVWSQARTLAVIP